MHPPRPTARLAGADAAAPPQRLREISSDSTALHEAVENGALDRCVSRRAYARRAPVQAALSAAPALADVRRAAQAAEPAG